MTVRDLGDREFKTNERVQPVSQQFTSHTGDKDKSSLRKFVFGPGFKASTSSQRSFSVKTLAIHSP